MVPVLLAFLLLPPMYLRIDKAGPPERLDALFCTLFQVAVTGVLIAFLVGQYSMF
jgi:hypothetical protein